MTDQRGKAKGSPKTGGRKKGSIATQTNEVKEAVLRVFNDLNAADEYLEEIAKSDPRLFLSLVAKLIPQASEVSIDHRVSVSIAEQGCTVHEIAAITGHTSLKEVQRYTKGAEQRLLAERASERLEDKIAQPISQFSQTSGKKASDQ